MRRLQAAALVASAFLASALAACGGDDASGAGADDASADGRATTDASVDATRGGDAALRDGAGNDATTDGATPSDDAIAPGDDGGALDSASIYDATPIGADAGTIDDASVACSLTPGPHTVKYAAVRGLAIDGGAPLVFTKPDGFVVHGHVEMPAPPAPFGQPAYATVDVYDPAGNVQIMTNPTIAGGGADYSVTLSPGAYYVRYQLQYQLATQLVTATAYDVLRVCGDAEHDVMLPALPAVTSVNVTVPGFAAAGYDTLALFSLDGTYAVYAAASSDVVSLEAPLGVELATFVANTKSTSTSISPRPTAHLTLQGNATLDLPAMVTLEGSITDGTGHLYTQFASVGCAVGDAPSIAHPFPLVQTQFDGTTLDASTRYEIPIFAGATCAPQLVAPTTFPADQSASTYFTLTAPARTFDAGGTYDFAIPSYAPVAVPVRVRDARDAGVATDVRATNAPAPGVAFTNVASESLTTFEGTLDVPVGTYDVKY